MHTIEDQVWMSDDKYNFPMECKMNDIGDNRLDVKPYGGLWTSTYTPNKENDCHWIQWCKRENYWTGHYGFLLEVEDDLRAIVIDENEDLQWVVEEYGKSGSMRPDNKIDFQRMANDGYDCMHLTRSGLREVEFPDEGQPHLYGWDSESTLWFNWRFKDVKYLRRYR